MAIKLGQIIVELIADTAKFIDGMTKSSAEARKTSKEIQESFEKMGSAAQGLLAPLGEVGAKLGEAFGGIGETFGKVAQGLSSLAGGASEATLAIGGAAAAVAALGVAGAGIAIFAAKSANEIHELSEKTGVSTETLSRFGYAAGLSGVSTESLGKGLEKLNKSVFAAATAPQGAVNAYTRMGIALRDSNGEIRPTADILLDLSDKLKNTTNSVARGALAQQAMGRGAAEMLPFLLRGKEGIKALGEEADALGITISDSTGEKAHEFEETLKRMQGALMGAANTVMAELLPSLQAFASFIFDELKDPSSAFRVIGGVIMDLVVPAFKILSSTIAVVLTAADYMTAVLSRGLTFVTTLVVGLYDAFSDLAHGKGIGGATAALSESFHRGLNEFQKGVTDDVERANQRLSNVFAKNIFGDDQDQTKKPEANGKDGADTKAKGPKNAADQKIAQLTAEIEKNAALSHAFTGLKDQTIALTAAAEAQGIINELNIKGAEKHIQVTGEQAESIKELTLILASYKEALNVNKSLDDSLTKIEQSTKAAEIMAAAYLQGADAVTAAKAQIELMPLQKHVTDLQAVYNQLVETGGSYENLTSILKKMGPEGAELAKQFKALGIEDISGLRAGLADAADKLAKLFDATTSNALAKQTEEANKKIGDLTQTTEAHLRAIVSENAAIAAGGKALKDYQIAQELEKTFPKDTDKQTAAYAKLKSELQAVAAQEKIRTDNQARQSLAESTQANIRALEQENAAILAGGTALKNFNLYKQLEKDYPSITDKETQAYKDQKKSLDDLNDLQLQNEADRKINALLKFNDLDREIDYLQKLRDSNTLNDQQKMADDALIHEDMLQQQKDYDALLLKTDSLGAGATAFFNDFATQGKTAAQQVYDVLNQTFTGIQDNLSKFITGQKTSWKELGKSIEDSLAKTVTGDAMKSITGGVLGVLGLGGIAGGKPDGTQGNPLHVRNVGAAGGIGGIGAPGGNPLSGVLGSIPLIGKLFGGSGVGSSLTGLAPDGTQQNPYFVSSADPLTAGAGGLTGALPTMTGGISSLFGGGGLSALTGLLPFLADGGDVTPGRAYVVGEKRPELFVPKSAGTIVPSVGNGQHISQTTVHMTVNTPDADSFKKSQGQISSAMGAAASRGQMRNGR